MPENEEKKIGYRESTLNPETGIRMRAFEDGRIVVFYSDFSQHRHASYTGDQKLLASVIFKNTFINKPSSRCDSLLSSIIPNFDFSKESKESKERYLESLTAFYKSAEDFSCSSAETTQPTAPTTAHSNVVWEEKEEGSWKPLKKIVLEREDRGGIPKPLESIKRFFGFQSSEK